MPTLGRTRIVYPFNIPADFLLFVLGGEAFAFETAEAFLLGVAAVGVVAELVLARLVTGVVASLLLSIVAT